jgi:AraC-like DNA-binding protein
LQGLAENSNVGDERRKNQRHKVSLQADIKSKEGIYQSAASSQNLSGGGGYFVSEQPPDVGDQVEIRLGSGLVFMAEVIRCSKLFEGNYGFAVRFLRPVEEELNKVSLPDPDSEYSDFSQEKKPVYQLELKDFNRDAFSYYRPLGRVQEFVDEHYCEEISLEKAASHAAMEKTYFSFFFRKKVGVTFSSWLQYLRVAKAMSMMESMDYSITEVAYAVGFQELSTFQKAFKKWTHLTPREFKKLARPV